MALSTAELLRATELTRAGRLIEATRAIQAALRADWPARPHPPTPDPSAYGMDEVIDVEARVVDEHARRVVLPSSAPRQPTAKPVREPSFTAAGFSFGADEYRYRLFVPARAANAQPLPVVVMLHGCKQDAGDFARGTGMNAQAEREQAIVIYPEQHRKANGMGCWNWFEPAHQRRGAGEPAMIAALAQHVAATHGGDPSRVYAAGLSAGAAMAALLGALYPDVFAAVGVHSGLPAGAAGDLPSALNAMRRGAGQQKQPPAIPTIVFHGSGDKTVAPRNADTIVSGQLAAWDAAGVPLTASSREPVEGNRTATRERWADAQGKPMLEVWRIQGGPHAWSGGHADGSFTDPRGPDASEAMLRFFLQHGLARG